MNAEASAAPTMATAVKAALTLRIRAFLIVMLFFDYVPLEFATTTAAKNVENMSTGLFDYNHRAGARIEVLVAVPDWLDAVEVD